MSLQGQGWLVTGGSRGIGLAIARAAAAGGATVVTCSRAPGSEPPVPGVHALLADVSDEHAVERLFDAAEDLLPRLDVVVNNAGATHAALLVNTTLADWQRTLDVNLKGPFLVCRRAVEELLGSGGGAIVNVGSFAAQGLLGQGAYAAAKAGLLSLTASIAKEYGRAGIRCNAVVPGFVHTDMTDAALDARAQAATAAAAPAGRLATPEEIAAAVLFLASSDASYVQGDALWVAGGLWEPPRL